MYIHGYKLCTDHKIAFTRSNGSVYREMSQQRILFSFALLLRDNNTAESISTLGAYIYADRLAEWLDGWIAGWVREKKSSQFKVSRVEKP